MVRATGGRPELGIINEVGQRLKTLEYGALCLNHFQSQGLVTSGTAALSSEKSLRVLIAANRHAVTRFM